MRPLLLAFTALIPGTAYAQAFDYPTGDQGVNWGTLSTYPTGSAPADDYEPAEATEDVVFDEADWIETTNGTDNYLKSSSAEKKIRLTCEPTTALTVDFILGVGISNFGHPHQGSGNIAWDQNSTYETARANPSSTCSGGPLNSTLYIEPEMLEATASGIVLGRRPQITNFYYARGIQSQSNDMTWIRRNTAFIIGPNPSNYNDTARRAIYAAAGFEYPGTPDTPAGFQGWQCLRGDGTLMNVTNDLASVNTAGGVNLTTTYSRYLKGPSGEDPWGGTCTGSVEAPGELILNLVGPGCWDRHNMRAPDGRAHFWYPARKTDNSITDACPTTTAGASYGHVPPLSVKTHFFHAGFADYGNLYFGSDRMNSSGTAADATSKSECRKVGPYFCNGETGHADWGYGWKSDILDEAFRECLGITVRGVAPTNGPAECNDGQISKYRKLQATGTSPDPAMSGGCAVFQECTDAVPGNIELYNDFRPGETVDVTIIHDHTN